MSEKFNVLQAAMASSERIFKLLDTPASIVSPAVSGGALKILQSSGELRTTARDRMGDEHGEASP